MENHITYIYLRASGELLGSVWIDSTGAWDVNYGFGVGYLPINSALKLMEYPDSEGFTIE